MNSRNLLKTSPKITVTVMRMNLESKRRYGSFLIRKGFITNPFLCYSLINNLFHARRYLSKNSKSKTKTPPSTENKVSNSPLVPPKPKMAVEVSNENSKKPIKIVLDEKDLEEKFVRGSGPGGQSVNKSNNCVQLTHIPTGISVSSHEQRELVSNRKTARRKLIEKLDLLYNGAQSKKAKKIAKKQKKKAKAKR